MNDDEALTDEVVNLLRDPHRLAAVGRQAYRVDLRWTELAHVTALWEMANEISSTEGETGPLTNQ